MQKKVLPIWLQKSKTIKFLHSPLGFFLSYWVFQGMRYMDYREILFKILIDVLLTLFFWSLGMPIFIAIILAHTANMFLNGHFFVLRRQMGNWKIEPPKFIEYVEKLHSNIEKKQFLLGAAAYGSLSKNLFKKTSDLDLRVFPREAGFNWLKTVLWVSAERFRALIHAFPLDIYAFDFDIIDKKMKADEPPILFFDPQQAIAKKYRLTVQFPKFLDDFKSKHLNNQDEITRS